MLPTGGDLTAIDQFSPTLTNAIFASAPNAPSAPRNHSYNSNPAPHPTLMSASISMSDIENQGSAVGNGRNNNNNNHDNDNHNDNTHHSYQDVSEKDAYGRLETPDASFLICNKTIIIGRNVAAFRRYKAQHQHDLRTAENERQGRPPPTPPACLSKRHATPSSEGGLLPEEGAQSWGARPMSNAFLHNGFDTGSIGNGGFRPKDDDHPSRLYIHGRGPNFFQTTKGISREHLKIQYNAKKRVWEAHGLGRNGFFCGNSLIKEGESVVLGNEAELQVQNIPMKFCLKTSANGKNGYEAAYSENGKAMSFDFTSSHRGQAESSDEEMDDAPGGRRGAADAVNQSAAMPPPSKHRRPSKNGYESVSGDEEVEYYDDYDIRETVEKEEQSPSDADQLSGVPFLPRKRGPGRPPKNGIMSKREEKMLRKQQQEEAKRNLPPQDPNDPNQKRKVGRPRKHPLPEGAEGSAEKRPYKSRKLKGEDGFEDAEGDKPAKERSQKHKTPPLELRREDFTEEQLQKPTKNYQNLIDEIMTSAPEKGYSLKQIYKRIQEKWPHFYFRVDTKGWESSVRHNLLGSECFKKIDGNWHRVAGVALEAGKKTRKPSDSTADNRPAMYNSYGQPPPYQHHQPGQLGHPGPPQGHQSLAHQAGLGQPNLPPRYPPNGQAYQMHQGPPANTNQLGGPSHPQGPPRSAFPQQQVPAPGPANAYAPAAPPPGPQYPGSQLRAPDMNYGHRPQPPQPVLPGPGPGLVVGHNATQQPPIARPGSGPPPPQAMSAAHVNPAPNMRGGPAGSQLAQPPPASLGPVIEPGLRDYIRSFCADVVKSLQKKEVKRAEELSVSVIGQGLKLTNRNLVPEAEEYQQLLLNLFRQHMQLFSGRRRRAGTTAKSTPTTAIVGAVPFKSDATTNTLTTGLTQSTPVPATSKSTIPAPAAPPTARNSKLPTGSIPTQTGSVSREPSSTVDGAANRGSENTSSTTTTSQPSKPSSSSTPDASTTSLAAASPVAPNAMAGSSATVADAAQGATAMHKTPTSAQLSNEHIPSYNSPHGPGPSATAAPPSGLSARGSSAAQATTTETAPTPSPAVTVVKADAPRVSPHASTPAAAAPPASVSRAVSTTPGTPASLSGVEDIEVLDPKLVDVILSFKRSIVPTLDIKLGVQVAESLTLSAICRVLGFTDKTSVRTKRAQDQKNIADAENTLMHYLEIRLKTYVNSRTS